MNEYAASCIENRETETCPETEKKSRMKGIPFLALPAGLLVFLLAPGRSSDEMKAPFTHRYFAHRGLYTRDQKIPENSLAAFAAAADAGYGIELDIQLTRDKKVVVFHDESLERACRTRGIIKNLTYRQLQRYSLFDTGEKIPLFEDVLNLIDGRVPLIIELKTQGRGNSLLCRKAMAILSGYKGPFCVESFDPRIVHWFRRHAPQILRGQLACVSSSYSADTPRFAAQVFSLCLCNFHGRPHFIAYELKKKPLSVRLAEAMGAMTVCWTSHDPKDCHKNEVVIFEHYRPPLRYR